MDLSKSEELAEKWSRMPDKVDILIPHGPPHGFLGGICQSGFDAGCELLLKRIKQVRPLVHVCGHIHEAYGVYLVPKSGTIVINASSVNLMYRATNPPIVFDVFPK